MSRIAITTVALLAMTGAVVLAVSPAHAQTDPAAPDLRKSLEDRKSELESTESRKRALEQDVDSLRAEREQLNTSLLETAAKVQNSERNLTEVESRLASLEEQENLKRGSLNVRYSHISKLLSALQRMGRNPPPVMITRREDALKMVRSAMLLSAAFPGMRAQALALAGELKELVAVMDNIRAERDKHKAETERLTEMRIRMAGLMETKKQSIAERRAELEKVRVAATEISRSVGDLNELIRKMDQASRSAEREAYEREAAEHRAAEQRAAAQKAEDAARAAAAAASQQVPTAEVSPPAVAATEPLAPPAAVTEQKPAEVAAIVTLPPKTASPPVVELAPQGSSLVPGNPGRITPAIEFRKAKAKLPMPAQGRRVLSFGEKTQYGGHSKGIVIETRFSAQITSPCDGWIVYAGEFRSYGQLLIINAGDGYHVLMAGLSQIDVQPGQFVLAAEPVGLMSGAPKSAPANAQSNSPVLYVEFRKDGDPIDPEPWWVDSQHKAQSEQKVQG